MHHHAEAHGDMHHCAYDRVSDACTCECWGASSAVFPLSLHGSVEIGNGDVDEYCQEITFPQPFAQSNESQVRVLTSVSDAQGVLAQGTELSPAVSWVQASSSTGFTACVQSPVHSQLRLQYFAFQMSPETGPWAESDAMTSWITPPAAGAAKTAIHCQNIHYRNQFESKPFVIGSVTRNGETYDSTTQGAVQFWVEDVDQNKFQVCFQAGVDARSTVFDSLYFNWVAFEHRNPLLWYHPSELPYSAAGQAVAHEKWVKIDGLVRANYRVCQVVPFGRSFTAKPTVLATSTRGVSAVTRPDCDPLSPPAFDASLCRALICVSVFVFTVGSRCGPENTVLDIRR
jgi:hypothetical protein